MGTGNIYLSAAIRSNLLSLQQSSDLIGRTQGRLASGLDVQTAVDDPVKFFSSKSLADRSADITEKKSAVDQSISTLNVAINAAASIDAILKQMKGVIITAKASTGTEKAVLQAQFASLAAQLNNFVGDATYNGTNLIASTATIMTVQFSNLSTSRLDITGVELNVSKLLIATAAANQASEVVNNLLFSLAAASDFDAGIVRMDAAIDTVRAAAKSLGSNVNLLQTRLDFSNLLANTLTQGADKLRLADMNEEGANLVALQTRQQLGFQALAFAGQAEQAILTLFR
jgi:flagellin